MKRADSGAQGFVRYIVTTYCCCRPKTSVLDLLPILFSYHLHWDTRLLFSPPPPILPLNDSLKGIKQMNSGC